MEKLKTITEYYFYAESINKNEIILSKEEINHIHKVLRINDNTRITLTDGLGQLACATIDNISSKKIEFIDIEVEKEQPLSYSLRIAIAPTKNINRFEWFIEKATEIGITAIQPILTFHSERKHIRFDRLEKVAVSAMKQSKKAWKPSILPIIGFAEFVNSTTEGNKYMAYLGEQAPHLYSVEAKKSNTIILIGPEGGFSPEEYELAKVNQYRAVSLGNSRLRTETAGVVATQIISMMYDKV
jgi:16S rRNA (uracil1498-N3)-methyltransferase